MAAALASPCLGMFIGHQCWPSIVRRPSRLGPPFALSHLGVFVGHQCWPSVIHHPSHLGPPFALSRWPCRSVIPVPAAQLGVLWWWSSLSLSSPPCHHLPYPIVVVFALIAVPSLPLHGPLCRPPFCHLLVSSSSFFLLLPLLVIVIIVVRLFRGCDMAGGAYLVRGCCVLPMSLPRHLRLAVSTCDQPRKQ